MPKQQLKIKGLITDIDNRFNEIIPSFSPFNYEFLLGYRLVDIFPNCFVFYSSDRKSDNSIKNHLHNLENATLQASSDSNAVIVVLDANIKNHVTTLITHIHIHDCSVIKTVHHAVNITTTEVELFAIRCSINQATYIPNIKRIVVITDSIHTAKRIFDSSVHPIRFIQQLFHMNSETSLNKVVTTL